MVVEAGEAGGRELVLNGGGAVSAEGGESTLKMVAEMWVYSVPLP